MKKQFQITGLRQPELVIHLGPVGMLCTSGRTQEISDDDDDDNNDDID